MGELPAAAQRCSYANALGDVPIERNNTPFSRVRSPMPIPVDEAIPSAPDPAARCTETLISFWIAGNDRRHRYGVGNDADPVTSEEQVLHDRRVTVQGRMRTRTRQRDNHRRSFG
jgi:hypothetical protein